MGGKQVWEECARLPDSKQNSGAFVLGVSAVNVALKQLQPIFFFFFSAETETVFFSLPQTPVCDGGLPGEVLPLHEDRGGRPPQQHRLSPQRCRLTRDQDPHGPGAIPVSQRLSV